MVPTRRARLVGVPREAPWSRARRATSSSHHQVGLERLRTAQAGTVRRRSGLAGGGAGAAHVQCKRATIMRASCAGSRAARTCLSPALLHPCARGRPPTRWSPRAGRRAHRAPSSRLHPRALATARAYQRLARPMPVAAAAARSAIVGYRRVRHAAGVRGLRFKMAYAVLIRAILSRTTAHGAK